MGVHPYRTAPKDIKFTPGDLAWFRKPLLALLLTLGACLPHVDPAPRTESAQAASVVTIVVTCSEESLFGTGQVVDFDTEGHEILEIEWLPPKGATGVVISERHVLTAAHATPCPAIPKVDAWMSTGKHERFVVERDDRMFPHGDKETDISRLELAYGGGLHMGLAPPVIRDAIGGEACCVQTRRGALCGTADPYHPGVLQDVVIRPGDSGSPVYCGSDLVGIATRTGEHASAYEPVTAYWLEGT